MERRRAPGLLQTNPPKKMDAPVPVRAFKVDALTVEIFRDQPTMAAAAAEAARVALADAQRASGAARAILASAASQIQFLDRLTSSGSLDWSRTTLFHMDEYLGIAPDHPASFRKFLREKVEARVRPEVFHYVEGESDQPLRECRRYTGLLDAAPLDLCCLGIGENGHIAFNDPPVADFQDPDTIKLVKLDEACRMQQVGEGAFPALENVPQYAFSLTIPALCRARSMVCVVPERRKARAVRDALLGPIDTACPASWLRRQPHARLFLDADSASLL